MMLNLKSLEHEFKAEMSKNVAVRIKRGLSRARSNSGGICREIAQNEADEESFISYKSTSQGFLRR